MKYLLALFMFISLAATGQYDSTKIFQAQNSYGFEWKNMRVNSSWRPPRDTPHMAMSDTGAIAVKGSIMYVWNLNRTVNRYRWDTLSGGGGGSGITNLGATQNAINYLITSSTGTSATLLPATTVLAGLQDTTGKRLLDSIRTGTYWLAHHLSMQTGKGLYVGGVNQDSIYIKDDSTNFVQDMRLNAGFIQAYKGGAWANKVDMSGFQAALGFPNTTYNYLNGYGSFSYLSTDSVLEDPGHLYFHDANARAAISLTTTGSSGASTYNNTTGVLNIPNYTSGGGSSPSLAAQRLGYGNASGILSGPGSSAFTVDTANRKAYLDSINSKNYQTNTVTYHANSSVYFGTSITAGTGAFNSDYRYSTVTARSFNTLEANYGHSGGSLQVDMLAKIPLIAPYNYTVHRFMVMEWLTNDIINSGNNVLWDTAHAGPIYRQIIDTCLARGWPASKIVIVSPGFIDSTGFANATGARQLQYWTLAQSVASSRGTKFVDIKSAEAALGNSILMQDGGLHPSNGGHALYAQLIRQVLTDSVHIQGQAMGVNGLSEFNKLKVRIIDTADFQTIPLGIGSNGDLQRFWRDDIIRNSYRLTDPQSAGINLAGKALFGKVTSPNAVDVVQANGSIWGQTIRAWGTVPAGTTGASLFGYYSGYGGLFAYDYGNPSGSGTGAKDFVINPFGQRAAIGAASWANSAATLTVNGPMVSDAGLFKSGFNFPSGGSGVGIGYSGSTGYISAYDFTGSTTKSLAFNYQGGNVLINTNSDNGVGALQVNGKLTVATVGSGVSTDSVLTINAAGEIRKRNASIFGGGGSSQDLQSVLTTGAVANIATEIQTATSGVEYDAYKTSFSGNTAYATSISSNFSGGLSSNYMAFNVKYAGTTSKFIQIASDSNITFFGRALFNRGIAVKLPGSLTTARADVDVNGTGYYTEILIGTQTGPLLYNRVRSNLEASVPTGNRLTFNVSHGDADSTSNRNVLSLWGDGTAHLYTPPSGSATSDSVIVWHPADSSFRKVNPASFGGNGAPFSDASALVVNSGDNTKLIKLSAANITTATTRTWTFPDVSGTFARADAAQTFTGIQTFSSSPVFPTPSPNSNDTKGATTAYVDGALAAFSSGTYTPTLSGASGWVVTPTADVAHWVKVGNEVTVSGYISGTPAGTGTDVSALLSIPTAIDGGGISAFSNVKDAAGVVTYEGSSSLTNYGNGKVNADTGSGLLKIFVNANGAGNYYYVVVFTYTAP